VGTRLDRFWQRVDAGVDAFRREDTPPPSDPSTVQDVPSRQALERAVALGDALSLGAVYRAISIRSLSAKQISIKVEGRDGEIMERTPLLIAQPDPDESRSRFVEKTSVSLDTNGNAFWRVIRKDDADESSPVKVLRVLNPLDVVIDHTKRGRVTGYQYQGRTYKPWQVKHLVAMPVPGMVRGLGPIQAAQVELRGALDTAEYGSDVLSSGDSPSGILKSDQIIDSDGAKKAKNAFRDGNGGKRGVVVLGQGLSYQQVYLSPRDAQFIESQQWSVTQVARLFGIPASLMLVTLSGESQTYANVEQDWLGFVRFSLMKTLQEIEEALTSFLPRGSRAKFNIEALLRADTKSRYEAYESALRAGWRTVDEIRELEGLTAMPATEKKDDPA